LDPSEVTGPEKTYRPMSTEELNQSKQMIIAGIVGFVLFWTLAICIDIYHQLSPTFRSNGPFVIIMSNVVLGIFSILLARIAINARKDLRFGKIECYQGLITDKYPVAGKPVHFRIKLNGVPFGIDRWSYDAVDIGEVVILEWMPYSPELLRVIKTGDIDFRTRWHTNE
jgi:hypothetical protein